MTIAGEVHYSNKTKKTSKLHKSGRTWESCNYCQDASLFHLWNEPESANFQASREWTPWRSGCWSSARLPSGWSGRGRGWTTCERILTFLATKCDRCDCVFATSNRAEDSCEEVKGGWRRETLSDQFNQCDNSFGSSNCAEDTHGERETREVEWCDSQDVSFNQNILKTLCLVNQELWSVDKPGHLWSLPDISLYILNKGYKLIWLCVF